MQHSQLQTIHHIVKEEVSEIYNMMNKVKQFRKELWQECDPTNPETAYEFGQLNNMNDLLREMQARAKKLAEISYSIKAELRHK